MASTSARDRSADAAFQQGDGEIGEEGGGSVRVDAARAEVAYPEGLEPPTCCLEGSCSIQLSYG